MAQVVATSWFGWGRQVTPSWLDLVCHAGSSLGSGDLGDGNDVEATRTLAATGADAVLAAISDEMAKRPLLPADGGES